MARKRYKPEEIVAKLSMPFQFSSLVPVGRGSGSPHCGR